MEYKDQLFKLFEECEFGYHENIEDFQTVEEIEEFLKDQLGDEFEELLGGV